VNLLEHCIVPEWPAPASIRAFVTTRRGGVSVGPYDSLNIGRATEDNAAAVAENRARLRALLPAEPRWLRQVHGSEVVRADDVGEPPAADGALSVTPGVVCAILVADCLPVLFTNRSGSIVAAAHAGWRGLAAGVLDRTVQLMIEAGTQPADVLAYLGPGIGPSAFEVGSDVFEAYTVRDPAAAAAFRPHGNGKWLADLFMLARFALQRAGVRAVYGGGLCTYSDPARFYSYRRDRTTGRMAALIWRER
jgi:polyphenol oxidase